MAEHRAQPPDGADNAHSRCMAKPTRCGVSSSRRVSAGIRWSPPFCRRNGIGAQRCRSSRRRPRRSIRRSRGIPGASPPPTTPSRRSSCRSSPVFAARRRAAAWRCWSWRRRESSGRRNAAIRFGRRRGLTHRRALPKLAGFDPPPGSPWREVSVPSLAPPAALRAPFRRPADRMRRRQERAPAQTRRSHHLQQRALGRPAGHQRRRPARRLQCLALGLRAAGQGPGMGRDLCERHDGRRRSDGGTRVPPGADAGL